VVALECGWIVTEVGRQPWTVFKLLRTEDAVTGASGIWITFAIALVLYAALGVATVIALRTMARRWREGEADEEPVPYGPPVERGTG
jgi:cytochrome d ubiquinol oxidase subunit I